MSRERIKRVRGCWQVGDEGPRRRAQITNDHTEDHLDEGKRNASEGRGVHEFLEVLVQKFKHQVQFVFGVDDI